MDDLRAASMQQSRKWKVLLLQQTPEVEHDLQVEEFAARLLSVTQDRLLQDWWINGEHSKTGQ